MIIKLLQPLTLLLSLSLILAFIFNYFERQKNVGKILSGIAYGVLAVIAMMTPYDFIPGFIFDSRSVIISLSGFLGGPVTATPAIIIGAGYRLYLGGAGAVAGAIVVLIAGGVGVFSYYLKNRYDAKLQVWHLLVFGFATHFFSIFGLAVLPTEVMWKVVKKLSIPFFCIYPFLTAFLGIIIHHIELHFDNKIKLTNSQEKYEKLYYELKKSENRFRALIKKSPLPMVITDKNQDISHFNDKFIELFGYTLDDVSTAEQWWSSAYPDKEYRIKVEESWAVAIESALENETDIEMQTWDIIIKNGDRRSCEFYMVPLEDVSLIVMKDITNQKTIEKKLDESNLFLKQAIKAGLIGLWNWDLKTNKVFYSSEWKEQIGYEDHEIENVFSEWEKRVHPNDIELTKATIEKNIKEINQEHRTEFRFRHKNGSYRWILSQASFVLDEDGQPVRMLGSHIDVTSIKKLEKDLQQAQKMESIGTLAGGIAHDFNNILSASLGFTELALDAVEKGTQLKDDLQEVYKANLRAKEMVSQILSFARQSDEKREAIQIGFVIQEVLKLIRSSIPTTIEIQQSIESDSFIMGNSSQIQRVIMNLCTNAAHAMEHEGGILKVTLKDIAITNATPHGIYDIKFGEYIEIMVVDTGVGIDPQIVSKIYDPYFTTKGPGEGTGMGLAMVYGIVETYGGKINVESSVGTGTAFTIYLPTFNGSNFDQEYKTKELPTGHERLLIVDDEPQIVKVVGRVLGELGYSVTTSTSSTESLELFRSKPDGFDLVISDVTMPEMAGDQLARHLIEIRPNIPIILCTGYSKIFSEEKASEIGVKAFAYKPIVKEDLVQTVRDVLDLVKN